MLDYKSCKERIEQEINSFNLPKSPPELYDPIKYVLAIGGKRLRPCLLMMAGNMFSEEVDHFIYPALAIEIFHNFTLLHDDIMDNAVLRRNHPTVHMKWDSNVAILSGDAMMTKSYQLLAKTESTRLAAVLGEFNKAALEVCEGQMYDMNFEKTLDVTVEEYINMIRLKTSVLIACSLKMGAILGGASEKDQELIYDFGLNLGIGFQFQDDLLDSFGDSAKFGKKIGGDIVANKKTFLLVTALAEANGDRFKRLKKLVTTYEFSREEKVEHIIEIYEELGIKEKTQVRIDEFFEKAFNSLNKVSIEPDRKKHMKILVSSLMNRFK